MKINEYPNLVDPNDKVYAVLENDIYGTRKAPLTSLLRTVGKDYAISLFENIDPLAGLYSYNDLIISWLELIRRDYIIPITNSFEFDDSLWLSDFLPQVRIVRYPDGLTYIPYNLGIRNRYDISEAKIPSSVTSVDDGAFEGLYKVFYNGTATGAPWGAQFLDQSGF